MQGHGGDGIGPVIFPICALQLQTELLAKQFAISQAGVMLEAVNQTIDGRTVAEGRYAALIGWGLAQALTAAVRA